MLDDVYIRRVRIGVAPNPLIRRCVVRAVSVLVAEVVDDLRCGRERRVGLDVAVCDLDVGVGGRVDELRQVCRVRTAIVVVDVKGDAVRGGWNAGWEVVEWRLKDSCVWVEIGLDFRRWMTLGRIGRGGWLRRRLRGDCEEVRRLC